MKNETKKVTLKSRWGLIPPVTFRILENRDGNYLVSYSAAKKATRNCSGDYYPGLEIYESHFTVGGSSYALVNKEVTTKNRREE